MKKFYVISFLLSCISWISYGQNAIIVTERSGNSGVVSFSQNSKLTGISDQRFVDGYVKKNGSGHFVFPVGDNGSYRPFAAESDGTVGAYFQENPNTASVPGGGPFSTANKETTVSNVSAKEFWHVRGTNATRLTFSWNTQSDIASLTGNSLPNLTIVGWNKVSSRWEKIASAVDEVNLFGGASTLTSGSISTIQSIVPNSYNVYALASSNVVSAPVNYSGALEVANCTEIKGYIWDKSYPDAELTVEIREGSVVHASVLANGYREDLKNGGIGTGNYGFKVALPQSLKDGKPHIISIFVRSSSYELTGSPKSVTCEYQGNFELADCNFLQGWVWDKSDAGGALTVELVEGNTIHETATANIYKADLKNLGYGTGNYGFSVVTPPSLKNGESHQLSARIKGTNYTLSGSAKTLACPVPIYQGNFEAADCNFLKGWVWDKNNAGGAQIVELVEGSTVLATATANIYKADLKDG
ncbi:T9SS C-terminal target domain-containing protein, partial [Dyadobacter sp. LJ53]|nr:T9SS C-terminal target domain-containing protein [Dyadobacter chenwenxiniae]